MGQVLSCGFLLFLLTTFLLHGASSVQLGGPLREYQALSMSEVEKGKISEAKVKNINMKEDVKINGEDKEKMHEMIEVGRGRELFINVDYHGPTTHPPSTPERRTPGTGPH